MILVNEKTDIIDQDYSLFLEDICNNFKPELSPFKDDNHVNYFYRVFIDINDEKSKEVIKKAELYVNEALNSDRYVINHLWINRINTESNKNDDFHNDQSVVSLIIYLNDGYTGGELEYITENKETIKIPTKKNMSILLTNKVGHRVSPVTEGTRYSLVFFFTIRDKKEKSLI